MKILGIETSADDTGVALIEAMGTFGDDFAFHIHANAVRSQTLHAEYGGIYPNLAKREHAKNLPILLERVLKETGLNPEKPDIDCIAVTVGPGLEPCLWTGINFAQELAKKWNVPVVPTNHMEGHILVSTIKDGKMANIQFPALALLISGGHTELILIRGFGRYEYLGRTRDDAVGEAFDKVARMLDLPYPGGPHISRLAESSRNHDEVTPHRDRIRLPRPMIHEKNFDFSFAGLKTAVLRIVEENKPLTEELKKEIAREFEDAAADVLAAKTAHAVKTYSVGTVIVGGGVSANKHIRQRLAEVLGKSGTNLCISPLEFTGDNAVMIAFAGYFHALKKEFSEPDTLAANGSLKLTQSQ